MNRPWSNDRAQCAATALGGACLLAALINTRTPAQAQPPAESADQPPAAAAALTGRQRQKVIAAAVKIIREMYVFADKADAMAAVLMKHMDEGAYENLANGPEFARRLTLDLRGVCQDKHISIDFRPEAVPLDTPAPENSAAAPTTAHPSASQPVADAAVTKASHPAGMAQFNHFGIERLERLAGEVWLLQLNEFAPLELSRETLTAAMNFVAPANALIIDLRSNSGGNPETEAFLAGFLFDQPQALSAFDCRWDSSHTEFTADPLQATGPRFGGSKPLYMLTSAFTFSAGEALAYDLQACRRAVIVGETTAGGAHPTDVRRLDERFTIRIPIAQPVNPITQSNWQGTGVQPDVPTSANRAMLTAHIAALRAIPRDRFPRDFAVARIDQIIADKERELAALN